MNIRMLVTSGLLATTVACAVNPATGRRELMLVSEEQEIQMGREADPQVTAMYGLVDDPELQSYVSDIGMRLAAGSERPELPWSFKVVDDPTVNAFALPGGFIYVTRGILAHFDSEAELAGVLGHEIGHVTARHSASQMSRQQLQQIGLGVGMIFSETFREYGGLAAAGLQIMNLSYSRDDESQSDRLGLRYISQNGYDPDAMIGVFEMLANVGGASEGGRLPEWQLTHPYPENREAQMREVMEENQIERGGTVDRDQYLEMLDGMIYGPNPREGFFENGHFLHPDLAFQLTFPSGWTTVNQRTAVGAIAPSEDGVVVLSIVPDGGAPDAELREFLRGEGITGGQISQGSMNGIDLARAQFEAQSEQGTLRGEAAFLRYDDNTYSILGYGTASSWSGHASAVGQTISSFAPVTDRSVLDVQPLRLDIVSLGQATSLSSYAQSSSPPVEVEELARLNRVGPGEVLSAGTRVKTVVGTPVGR